MKTALESRIAALKSIYKFSPISRLATSYLSVLVNKKLAKNFAARGEMKNLMKKWRDFIEESKKPKDSKLVTKVVLYNEDNKVLFLKRSKYIKKFGGEWDIPGGHVHEGEDLLDGLKRETYEETGLKIKNIKKIKKVGNKHYYSAKLPKGKIKLSDEHTGFEFRDTNKIKDPNKFEKIAKEFMKGRK